MAKKLQILLEVKADGTQTFRRVGEEIAQVEKSAAGASRATKDWGSRLESINAKGGAIVGSLATSFAAAATAAAGLSVALVGIGVRYNAQIEQSRLGIASLVSSLGEIRGSQGQVLQGQERWNAAIGLSESIIGKLRVAALQTTAEFSDLVRVLQEGLGPALQAGFNDDQVVKFTKAVAQAGSALGIRAEGLGQEMRALLSGEKGPDNRLANALFGDVANAKAKIEELRASGKLFDFLMEKMAAFSKAGEQAADTFDGALSNLKDAITQALGEATQGATSGLTQALKDLTSQIVTFDAAGNAVFNARFVEGVRALGEGFIGLANGMVAVVREAPDFFAGLEDMAASIEEWRMTLTGTERGNTNLKDNLLGSLYTASGLRYAWEGSLGAMGSNRQTRAGLWDTLGAGPEDRTDIYGTDAGTRNAWETQQAIGRARAEQIRYANLIASGRGATMYGSPIGPMPGATLGSKAAKPDTGAIDKLRKQEADYERWIAEFRAKAEAAGDPLAEALVKIEGDREAAIAKIDETNKDLKSAVSDKSVVNSFFDQQVGETWTKSIVDGSKKLTQTLVAGIAEVDESARAAGDMLAGIQQDVEADRINAIEDATERELAIRRDANEQWLAQMQAQAVATIKNQKDLTKVLDALDEEKARRDKLAEDEAERKRQQQIAGSAEWAKKVSDTITDNLGTVAEDVENAMTGAVGALQGAFNELFNGLLEGQADFGAVLKNFAKSLGSTWANTISNMITRSIAGKETIVQQFKEMFAAMNNPGTGAEGFINSALGGAGVGAMIGGIGSMLKPGSYAAEGGMVGGMIGGIVGYFTAVGPVLGSIIGSVIGTAIGSAIGKGKDFIKVQISRALGETTVTVDEKGISAEGRARLVRDIKRAVDKKIKEYDSLLDLFPVELRDKLQELVKPLDLKGGAEGGDITDAGALQALSDFLGETLNQAVFVSYSDAIKAGLEALGVSADRITEQFAEWGTLTGEDLQGAIRSYLTALVETIRVRDLFIPSDIDSMNSSTLIQQARDLAAGAKPEQRIKSMIADLGVLISNLPKLDPSDQIAAMEQVNALGQQIWNNMIAQLQRIDQIQESIHQSLQATRESILTAGMDKGQKGDFMFERLRKLREQLLAASDPDTIQQIVGQMNGYINQLLSLDPDNKELRDKLLGMLGEITGVSDIKLQEARERVLEEQKKAYELLQQAAQALLEASQNFDPGAATQPPAGSTGPGGDGSTGPGGDRGGGGIPRNRIPIYAPDPNIVRQSDALVKSLGEFGTAVAAAGVAIEEFRRRTSAGASTDGAQRTFGGTFGAFAETLPSHASGLGYVPYDDYIARLHKGEQVVPADVAAASRRGTSPSESPARLEVHITGPGVDFLNQVGATVSTRIYDELRRNPRRTTQYHD